MPVGMEVISGLGDTILDGGPAPPWEAGQLPPNLGVTHPVIMAEWAQMPFLLEVGSGCSSCRVGSRVYCTLTEM